MKLIPADDPPILVFIPADLPPEHKVESAGTSSGMKTNIGGTSSGMKIKPEEHPPILAVFSGTDEASIQKQL